MNSPAGGRVVGVFALAAAVALVAGAVATTRNPGTVDHAMVAAAAQTAAGRAVSAFGVSVKNMEPRAAEAARVPQIGAALSNHVDAQTFQDLFESEEWWRPFREPGQFSALVAGEGVLVSLFPEKLPFPTSPLVARARNLGIASGVIAGDGRLYAVAASRVDRSEAARTAQAVVLVGRLLDDGLVGQAAERAGTAMGLSDGRRLYVGGGQDEPRRALAGLVGQEGGGAVSTLEGFPAVATQVDAGLWLWAVSAARVLPQRPAIPAVAWGGGAAVLGLLGLLLLRPRPRAAPMAPASPRLAGSGGVPAKSSAAPPLAEERAAPVAMSGGGGGQVATALLPNNQPTDEVGRYTLLRKIGEGGMAEVFQATIHGAEGFKRALVVKRLHKWLATNKEAVSQFIDEAQLQAGLVHSNIVPVFDFGKAGDDYFLALEYIRGRDLDKLLLRHMEVYGRPMALPVVAHIIHEVLEALSYAHTRVDRDGRRFEIVHRDVSLANILVSYQGEVKLSDFGIVKAERRVSRTQVGMVKGNASFMAPEQARGENVDARADVFAAGVVLFYCLTGHALYQGESTLSQLLRAAAGPATAQFQQIAQLPATVAEVLAKALAPDPARRYDNAKEFARALRPIAQAGREDVARLMQSLFSQEMHEDRE